MSTFGDVKYSWDEECFSSFSKLKDSFLHESVLAHADLNLPFILETDTSGFALGGILSQIQDGIMKLIAFYS